jgi:hypothetical protein
MGLAAVSVGNAMGLGREAPKEAGKDWPGYVETDS